MTAPNAVDPAPIRPQAPAMTPPLPPSIVALLGCTRWPTDIASRRALYDATLCAFDARRDLLTWAHAVAERAPERDLPSAATYGAVVGLSANAVRGERYRSRLVGGPWPDLPLAAAGRRRAATVSAEGERARRRRAAAKTATPARRAKTSASKAV